MAFNEMLALVNKRGPFSDLFSTRDSNITLASASKFVSLLSGWF